MKRLINWIVWWFRYQQKEIARAYMLQGDISQDVYVFEFDLPYYEDYIAAGREVCK